MEDVLVEPKRKLLRKVAKNYCVLSCIATIKLLLCHSLVRSVILWSVVQSLLVMLCHPAKESMSSIPKG